jgi:hypothetical protein
VGEDAHASSGETPALRQGWETERDTLAVCSPMKIVRWSLFAVVCWSCVCAGQLKGRFYVEQETYALGEPVFLYFEIRNESPKTYTISAGNPYSNCSGYRIEVAPDPPPASFCSDRVRVGSCVLSQTTLGPGKRHVERLLLNFDHEIQKPGYYVVTADRRLRYAERETLLLSDPAIEVKAELRFRTDSTRKLPADLLTDLADRLHSSDPQTVTEAARTLASIAPLSMESTLLEFPENSLTRPFAPLAFHRLNTRRSTTALSQLLRNSRVSSPESIESAGYLGNTGDPQWFPQLRQVATQPQVGGEYVYPAAQAGGDKAIPFCRDLMGRGDKVSTEVAVSAFAYTGSRAAIPILLELLQSRDFDTAGRALYGLRRLTHLQVGSEDWPSNPQAQYARWQRWWNRSKKAARIYRAGECGEFKELP